MTGVMTSLTGTRKLIRLILRRDRFLLPAWVVVLALLPVVYVSATRQLYPTAAGRLLYQHSINSNPSFLSLLGPAFSSSLGSLVAWRGFLILTFTGLFSLLTVIRHTRTEEEAGRRELLGSTVVGRHAPLVAALAVTFVADLVMGGLLALFLMGTGLPATGAVAYGLSGAAIGIMFGAVGAATAQLAEGAGAARGLAIVVLGAAYLLRAAGDAGGEHSSVSWLSWVSPLGWAQRVRPFAGERWWVFAPMAAFALVFVVAAVALSARRDIGAGVLAGRPGRATASGALSGPVGLAWRMHRALLVGWSAGFVVLGLVMGGAANGARQLADGSPQLGQVIEKLGGTAVLADALLAAVFNMFSLIAAGYAIQATLRMRTEENAQRAEPVLATGVGRVRWALAHLLFGALGPAVAMTLCGLATGLVYGLTTHHVGHEVPRELAGAVAQLPAVWVLTGLTALLFGLLPRLAMAAWVALAGFLLLGQFGELLKLNHWLRDVSPFSHIPKIPGGTFTATPLVWLTVIAVAMTAAGLAGLRRRDIG